MSESFGQPRRSEARCVDVALNFGERDGAVGEPAVGVEDRVLGVPPTLLDETPRRLPVIFDESVTVPVAPRIDPVERRLDVRPERLEESVVAGAIVVGRGEHDEERRRVDAAVVPPERDLAERGHFPLARLVEDLPGLGVVLGVELARLRLGEVGEHALRERRIEPERLQGRHDPVASERSAEPGHPGERVGAGRKGRRHHLQVRRRAPQPRSEGLVRTGDRGLLGGGRLRAGRRRQPRRWPILPRALAVDRLEKPALFSGLQAQREDDSARAHFARLRIAVEVRLADDAVPARIGHPDAAFLRDGRKAAPFFSREVPRTSKTSAKSASTATDMRTLVGSSP
jgi:hypothetical protein